MELDAQRILNILNSIESEVTVAESISIGEARERLGQQLYMLGRIRDAIFNPDILDQWEHEAGRGDGWTKVSDLTEEF